MAGEKKYFFRIAFGEFRDSDDIEGKVTESSSKRPSSLEIISVLPQFVGKIRQVPSRFSAIKINGSRAYELARKGQEFEVPPREVEIFSLKFLSNNSDFAEFEVTCSKGTYIRSLARDICKKIGVCGYVFTLTRLQVGNFSYEKRIPLDGLKSSSIHAPRFLMARCLQMQDVSSVAR